MQTEFEYYAFISYCHKDKRVAKEFQRKLESYRIPSFLKKQHHDIPKRMKIYRDDTDAEIAVLPVELKKALEKSRFLIILCSPESTKRSWIGWEIQTFIELNRKDNIIPIIIEGEPYSDDADKECFHATLIKHFPKKRNKDNAKTSEILGVDYGGSIPSYFFLRRYIEKERALVRVVAKLWSLQFGVLWRNHKIHLLRKWATAIAVLLLFIIGISVVWLRNKPVDVSAKIYELTTHNENLPEGDEGKILFIIGNDTITKNIKQANSVLPIMKIPGSLMDTKIKIHFHMYGYNDLDTIVKLKKQVYLGITRDESIYGTVKGYVKDADIDRYIKGCSVSIEGFTQRTDEHGYFEIHIPLPNQRTVYDATLIYLDRSEKIRNDIYPLQGDENRKNILFITK